MTTQNLTRTEILSAKLAGANAALLWLSRESDALEGAYLANDNASEEQEDAYVDSLAAVAMASDTVCRLEAWIAGQTPDLS